MVRATIIQEEGDVPRTVLIDDDHPAFRTVAERLLTARGLEVVGAVGSCGECTEAVRRLRPDGVLLDVGLPDGDGYVLARELYLGPEPLVVVLTSTDASHLAASTLTEMGVRAFVPKHGLVAADLRALFAPVDR